MKKIGWLEALAMESRSFGGSRPRGGRGKSNFVSRDYRMEGRRGENNSRGGGGGGGGRYGNSGGNMAGRIITSTKSTVKNKFRQV